LLYIKDSQYKFTLVNKAVTDAYQMKLEDIVGRGNEILVSNKDQLTTFQQWEEETLEKGTPHTNYVSLEVAPGQSIYVQSMKRAIYGKNNEIEGILGVLTDLSYQKQIEQSILEQKHFSESITHIIPVIVVIVDLQSNQITYSNAKDKFLDYSLADIQDLFSFFKKKIHPDDYSRAISQLFQSVKKSSGDQTFEEELRVKDSKDHWYWFREQVKVFKRDENGEVSHFLIVLQDINEEKIKTEELAKSEQRYRNFIEYSSDGIYFMSCGQPISIEEDVETQIQKYYETAYIEECNLALAKMYGEEKISDIQGKRIADIHTGKHYEDNVNSIRIFMKNGYRANNIETIEQDKNGNWHYFLNHAVAVIENGQFLGIWGTQQDITEQKLAGLALKESQERLDMVIGSASLGTWDWDIQSNQVLYNEYWAKMLGYELGELGHDLSVFLNAIHPDDANRVWQLVEYHLQNNTPFFEGEFRMKTKDGKWKWIYDRGKVMEWDENGIPIRALGTHMDITQRKESEIYLKESEEFFRNLFEESPLAIAFINMEGAIFRVNPQFCTMLGYNAPEVIGKELTAFYDQEEDLFQVLAEESNMDDRSGLRFEKAFIGKNGDRIWARIAMGFIQDEEENFKHIICMAEDVTDRVQAETHLSEREDLNQAILNALPDLKFRMDINGVFLDYFATDDSESDLYASPKHFLGKNVKEILPPAVSFAAVHNAKTAIRDQIVKSFEYILPFDDEKKYYEARLSRINDTEVIVVIRNITELKKAQLSLQEKFQELDVKNKQLKEYIDSNMQLENFAYIASHDLREPVRTMRSFAQLLQRKYGGQLDDAANTYIKFIVDSSNHMNSLIQDLLTYSRIDTQEHEMEDLDINEILEGTIIGLKELIEEKGAEIKLTTPMPKLRANETKMKQLFQNLINNAIKFHKPDVAPIIQIECKELNHSWQFKVKDNGIGILPEFKEKIFVLFKKLHRRGEYEGTGLGLAICKKIVEQHGGEITVDSMLGSGASFIFTISKEL
jgi:PAS domain S-box-containing protein